MTTIAVQTAIVAAHIGSSTILATAIPMSVDTTLPPTAG